jgi:L-alanine-DL-glutamate epimerase-like enolase superfamily enzyme
MKPRSKGTDDYSQEILMKVTEIITELAAGEITEELRAAYGTRRHFEWVVVKVETDEGITGYGESVGLFHKTAETLIQSEIKPLIQGEDPFQIEYLHHRLHHLIEWNPFAAYPISAIDMALHDIKAKKLDVPLYELLGGLYHSEVSFSGLIHIHSVEEDVASAVSLVNDYGFKTLKFKVGRDPAQDEERLREIRAAVGNSIRIRVDPNMAWSPRTAVRLIRRWERYDLEYVEQPVPSWDLDGLKEVASAVDVPICADESCQSPRDALNLAEARACEVFCVYLSEAGGIKRLKEIIAIADTAGIQTVLGTWGESGIGFAAGLHVAASSRNFSLASDQGYYLLKEDYTDRSFPWKNGTVAVPAEPGLGVAPLSKRLERLKKNIGKDRVFDDTLDRRFIPRSRSIQV